MNAFVPSAAAAGAAIAMVAGARRLIAEGAGGPPLGVPRIATRFARGRALGTALQRAGLRFGPDAFVLLAVVASLVAATGVWVVVGNPVIALLAGAGMAAGANVFVQSAERRYIERFAGQLPVVAQQLGSALGAGLSLRQAIGRAADDAPEPASSELRQVARDLQLGARTDDALAAFAERVPDPGLRILVTAIQVQRVVGGNLAHALSEMSARLEERAALEREARSATAQARMSAWLVAALPLAGGVFVEIAAPGTLARTVGHGAGLGLLLAATIMELAGVAVIRQILRAEEET